MRSVPSQLMIKIVKDELSETDGWPGSYIQCQKEVPAVILIAGLQGSGNKINEPLAAKLANFLKTKKRVILQCW